MYSQLKLDNQLCFRLYTASRLVTQAYRPFLEPLGLTYPQYLVLLVLWEQDNRTVGEISEKLMLETNTVTPLLQRMERDGLILRVKGSVDGRQKLVSLTKLARRMEEKAKDIPHCMTANWNIPDMDEQQLLQFVKHLDDMIAMLNGNC